MPANLKELRGKIRNVKSTQQITKAMKLVSAAKFGRAQQSVVQSRPYFSGLSGVVSRLCAQSEMGQHELVKKNSSKEVLLFVVSSQRGLCGGYNANIAKEALAEVRKIVADGYRPTIICLGRKAYQLLSSRLASVGFAYSSRMQIEAEQLKESRVSFDDLCGSLALINLAFDKASVELGRQLGELFRDLYMANKVHEVRIVFSRFGSAITQIPSTSVLLPMQPATAPQTDGEEGFGEYIYEPNIETLVSAALPRFLDAQVMQILKEALASEHGARMTAMDNATRNAKDMERKYQIRYQRARQAAITTELVEIISGAEAL